LSDNDSLSSSSQPVIVTRTSIVDSAIAIVTAAEVIAAVSAAMVLEHQAVSSVEDA